MSDERQTDPDRHVCECHQRHQGVIQGRGQSDGDQDGADIVAIQTDDVDSYRV
jgi:hypothetical protein